MFSYIIMGEIYGAAGHESIDIKNYMYYFVNYFPNKVLNIENGFKLYYVLKYI